MFILKIKTIANDILKLIKCYVNCVCDCVHKRERDNSVKAVTSIPRQTVPSNENITHTHTHIMNVNGYFKGIIKSCGQCPHFQGGKCA